MRIIIGYAVIVFGAALVATGFNLFLVPHQLLSGGVSGIAMLVGYYSDWSIGILYFVFNLPIMVWGWFMIGRRFIILSILSVILTSWFIQLISIEKFIQDPVLGSVFGGVLVGIGTGITLRVGGSTGGFDIIGSILTRKRDFPLGMIMFLLNGFVILILGFLDNWDSALYSMLAIYISGKIVDNIHIRHVKVTAFIVTNETQKLLEQLLLLPRGVTIIKTQGAYSHSEKDLLMTVTTRYELAELRKIIHEIDRKAFVNIVETVAIFGEFTRKS
ncbi:MAG: YitT family protein [Paenibacillaceae bacterium]